MEVQLRFAGCFTRTLDTSSKPFIVDLNELQIGYNFLEKHIVNLSETREVVWVVSRLCDHANGTLHPCENNLHAKCPLHGWKLDLENLRYKNIDVEKKKIDFRIHDQNLIIDHSDAHLSFPEDIQNAQVSSEFNVRFLAHACLNFNCGKLNIVTDPWLTGPCFANGWWHDPRPSEDALLKLQNADLLYISHNHPDHMHTETLQPLAKSRPEIPIIVPNFQTKSTERPLKKLGFTNIHALAFNQIYAVEPENVYVSILKSGDFRDDSGLYINFAGKQALITVDSSILNQLVLPTEIDFLATSFAGGASGYPWCFDHYSENEKQEITNTRHNAIKQSVMGYLNACRPKAYMPYAGYFSELASRDAYIRKNNHKISKEDIKLMIKQNFPNTVFIDPIATDLISLNNAVLATSSDVKRREPYSSGDIKQYLDTTTTPSESEYAKSLAQYFEQSSFIDNLHLYIAPCDDDFNATHTAACVDFSGNTPVTKIFDNIENCLNAYHENVEDIRKLLIKVRVAALWDVICNYKSWEELSIGFQCRIHRKPDVYNSKFWYHFSNIYIR